MQLEQTTSGLRRVSLPKEQQEVFAEVLLSAKYMPLLVSANWAGTESSQPSFARASFRSLMRLPLKGITKPSAATGTNR